MDMTALETRNYIYDEKGGIICDINHPQYGWIPFTASPNDIESYGKDIYDQIIASGLPIAPYVPPPVEEPEPVRDYGAEIDALTARVTALETQVAALGGTP